MNRRSFTRFLVIASLVATTTVSCSLFQKNTNQNGQNNPTIQNVDVGAVLPLTGPVAYLGEGEKLGMELALQTYQKNNPNAKTKVKFTFEDSQAKPDLAVSAVRKLLDFQNINLQVVSTTGVSLATLPIFQQSGKDVLVFAQATVPRLTKNYPFAYRVYITGDQETKLLADYAKQKKYLKIGALYVRNKSGEDSSKLFQEKLTSFGGQVVISESFAIDEKDFRSILEKFKKANLDAIMVYAYANNYPTIAQQMDELELNLPVLANYTFATDGVEKKVSVKFLNRVIFPAPHYYIAENDPIVQRFNEQVKALGKDPTTDIALFYDMTNILLKGITNSPSTKPSDIGASILKVMPYNGVIGTINLNSDRDSMLDLSLVKFGAKGKEVIPTNN